MKEYKITDEFFELKDFLLSIPSNFESIGSVIQDNRNITKKVITPHGIFVIKCFKRMYFFNRLAYSWFRKSKALRSYTYSCFLNDIGVTTPPHVAWIDCYKYGLLTHSYYVSVYYPYKTLEQTLQDYNIYDPISKISLFRQMAAFVARLHNLGIYHADFSIGNILVMQTSKGYDFALVDLNKIKLGKVSYRKGLQNFSKLALAPPDLNMVIKEYAMLSDMLPGTSINIFWHIKKRALILHTIRRIFRLYTLTPIERIIAGRKWRIKLPYVNSMRLFLFTNVVKLINKLRRSFFQKITTLIVTSHREQNIDFTPHTKIRSVLICRPNHRLGNQLLITPLLQEVIYTFPEVKIDLFVKGNFHSSLFINYNNINHIINLPNNPFTSFLKYVQCWLLLKRHYYDLVINVVDNSSSGRLAAHLAGSTYKFFCDTTEEIKMKYKDHEHIAKYPVYSFRNNLSKLGFVFNERQVPFLDIRLGALEIIEGRSILKRLVNNEKKTICLFTYATGDKCYSKLWWEAFYERLRIEFQQYNIMELLPIENISQISFRAPTYYSKDVRQIGSLIANTDVFIAADSGMMHLASAVHTPTVGLFKVTDANVYAPYNPNSLAINTPEVDTSQYIEILNKILTLPN